MTRSEAGLAAFARVEADPERRVEGFTRAEVCRRFQGKVVLLARRLHDRLASESTIAVDDLAAVGAIGLLEAFDRFDPGRGIQFTTFAEYRVRGAMVDLVREQDAFGRRRRQLARRIERAGEQLAGELGRKPTPSEVATCLGLDMEDYWAAVDRTAPVQHVALDGGSHEGDDRTYEERLPDPTAPVDARMVAQEVRDALKAAIQELPERQRQCVMMYYGSELTLAEIAAVLGVTVSRVSQILTESRERLRKKLLSVLEPSDIGSLM